MAPTYVRPEAPISPSWPDNTMPGDTLAPPTTLSIADTGWRTFFTDPNLQRIIELALANNRDLRVSALNIERARGMYQIQRADLLPGVNATGESVNKGTPAALSQTGERTVSRQATAGLAMSGYELDFFGRIQSLKDKALEEYLGTEQALKSAQISLVSNIAGAYLALVADRERL
ncbi:MAG: TolC family protein, partial [Bilophila sp.]